MKNATTEYGFMAHSSFSIKVSYCSKWKTVVKMIKNYSQHNKNIHYYYCHGGKENNKRKSTKYKYVFFGNNFKSHKYKIRIEKKLKHKNRFEHTA